MTGNLHRLYLQIFKTHIKDSKTEVIDAEAATEINVYKEEEKKVVLGSFGLSLR